MSYRGKRSQLFVAIGAFFVIFGSTASDALPPQADKPANEENWSIDGPYGRNHMQFVGREW